MRPARRPLNETNVACRQLKPNGQAFGKPDKACGISAMRLHQMSVVKVSDR
jgi:hypothetical protein